MTRTHGEARLPRQRSARDHTDASLTFPSLLLLPYLFPTHEREREREEGTKFTEGGGAGQRRCTAASWALDGAATKAGAEGRGRREGRRRRPGQRATGEAAPTSSCRWGRVRELRPARDQVKRTNRSMLLSASGDGIEPASVAAACTSTVPRIGRTRSHVVVVVVSGKITRQGNSARPGLAVQQQQPRVSRVFTPRKEEGLGAGRRGEAIAAVGAKGGQRRRRWWCRGVPLFFFPNFFCRVLRT